MKQDINKYKKSVSGEKYITFCGDIWFFSHILAQLKLLTFQT